MSADATPSGSRRGILIAVVAVVIVVVAVVLWWLLGGDEPEAVDLTRTAEDAADDAASAGDAETDAAADDAVTDEPGEDLDAPPAAFDLDGLWVVSTERVAFDREAGSGSFVGYRVDEELSTIGATTAVGRTPEVVGAVEIVEGTVVAATITADLTALQSDSGSRDGRVRSTLGEGAVASFALLEDFEAVLPAAGEVIATTARGELTIRDQTRSVEVSVQTAVIDGLPVIAGQLDVVLSDYGVSVPSAPIVLSASDEAVLEWQLFLEPA